jgi:hypothetical protein
VADGPHEPELYQPGAVKYIAEPVFDRISQTGDVRVVTRVQGNHLLLVARIDHHVRWPTQVTDSHPDEGAEALAVGVGDPVQGSTVSPWSPGAVAGPGGGRCRAQQPGCPGCRMPGRVPAER